MPNQALINGGPSSLRRYGIVAMPLASMLVAAVVLLLNFGPEHIVAALNHANLALLALAWLLGAAIEAIKARRAQLMLSRSRPITFGQSFATMMVSYGAGHFVPVAPTGFALRTFLTQRVAGIPITFSTGVFLAGGILDSLGALPLLGYLAAAGQLLRWERVLIAALVVQALVFLALAASARLRHLILGSRVARDSGVVSRFWKILDSVASGVATMVEGGRRMISMIAVLSLISSALGVARLICLLAGFGLGGSMSQILLVMVLSGLVGSIPLQIPGGGTWAAGQIVRIAGIVGGGTGGYILISRVIANTESPIIGLALVVWWSIRHGKLTLNPGSLLDSLPKAPAVSAITASDH
ncbi:MAG: flippase-like domain-containing protein [Chloroflexota bacterium]